MSTGARAVWIVDDDDSVRESLRGLLEAYNYDVRAFESSAAFLAAAGAERCDCLLLDLNLPPPTGLDILQRIRRRADAAVPVVIITGRGGKAARRRVLAAGANAYLEKPFEGEELLKVVGALTLQAAAHT